ncbi:MAG: hypothetical protein ACR2HE_08525 [Casimicrobiaceae bacterium]
MTAGKTKSGGTPIVTRATHKNGGKLYVELAFGIVSDTLHGVLGALATAKDITQSYLANRAQRNR